MSSPEGGIRLYSSLIFARFDSEGSGWMSLHNHGWAAVVFVLWSRKDEARKRGVVVAGLGATLDISIPRKHIT